MMLWTFSKLQGFGDLCRSHAHNSLWLWRRCSFFIPVTDLMLIMITLFSPPITEVTKYICEISLPVLVLNYAFEVTPYFSGKRQYSFFFFILPKLLLGIFFSGERSLHALIEILVRVLVLIGLCHELDNLAGFWAIGRGVLGYGWPCLAFPGTCCHLSLKSYCKVLVLHDLCV